MFVFLRPCESDVVYLEGVHYRAMNSAITSNALELTGAGKHKELRELLRGELRGFDVDSLQDQGGFSACYIAADRGHTAVVRVLLDAKSNPNVAVGTSGATPLMRAAMNGHTDVATLLLERKVDPAMSSLSGDNGAPLYCFCSLLIECLARKNISADGCLWLLVRPRQR